MPDCLPEDELVRFRAGECRDESRLDWIAQHLAACRDCATRFANLHRERTRIDRRRTGEDDSVSNSSTATRASQVAPRLDMLSGAYATQTWDDHWPPPPPLADHPRWQVLDVLGVGGTGAVYLAEDRTRPGEFRALKILQPSLSARRHFAARFRREVELMQSIPPHENLVLGYEAESLDPYQLLVMEYVAGVDLEALTASPPTTCLPSSQAVGLMLQALAGLDHAWRTSGVVHRDIKPGNLMLTREGIVKLLDFGLAKLREGPPGLELTRTGISGGTPKYCSPEQDRDLRLADIRSDLYSIGCTLFRLIAGEPVFGPATGHSSDVEVRVAHHQVAPRLLRSLAKETPSELSAVVDRLLAKHPGERPATPAEAARLLLPFAAPADQQRACRHFSELSRHDLRISTQAGGDFRDRLGRILAVLACLAMLLVACGLVFRVQTKAGIVEIAVDDRPPEGVAVVEESPAPYEIRIDDAPVDRTRIQVRRQGERQWLVVEAVAGERRVQVSRPGFRVASEQVRVEAGRSAPLEIRLLPADRRHWPSPLESTTFPTESSSPAERPASPPVDRLATVLWGSGRWEVVDDELHHYDGAGRGEQWLLFGDPQWQDYDFEFEVRHEGFPQGVTALFRSPDDRRIQHFGFGWHDFYAALVEYREGDDWFRQLVGPNGPYFQRLDEPIRADQWYRTRIRVRGDLADCEVDGRTILEVKNNPFPRGRVGVRIWRLWQGQSRFRNIKVVSPDGVVLWQGPPQLPGDNPRRFVVDPPIDP
ncbi:MAG: protein kinase [Pirellulales bacterium]